MQGLIMILFGFCMMPASYAKSTTSHFTTIKSKTYPILW